jgi:hypothetical protein
MSEWSENFAHVIDIDLISNGIKNLERIYLVL